MATKNIKKTTAKDSRAVRVFSVFNHSFLVLISLIFLYPMVYVLFASLSDNRLLMQHTGLLARPLGFSLAAYKAVFANPMIILGYRNTLFVLITGVFLCLFMTSLGAYFLSRKRVKLKMPIMMLITFTMFFSGGTIPFYLNLRDLHLTNTLWGLVFPFLINTYNMIILRTSFNAIPESLTEAAFIDGAGHAQILFRIVIPLSKAILAVMILYYGIGFWNGWFWATVILRNRVLYPLQVILREILLQNSVETMTLGVGAGDQEAVSDTIKFATIVVATVPVLTIYPFLQKYFARGVMIGAVKE
jgi:putative aldouronate transport system permease protein